MAQLAQLWPKYYMGSARSITSLDGYFALQWLDVDYVGHVEHKVWAAEGYNVIFGEKLKLCGISNPHFVTLTGDNVVILRDFRP